MRRNRAEFNVAGIEIENSINADVENNTATNNTGGLLVFNLPDLPVQGGSFTRVFENQVYGNNTDNFAPKGNIVAKVPTGTGIMIMSTHDIEIFKNTLKDNETSNVSLVSYLTTGNPLKDPKYDPFVESIWIHDNSITGGGHKPAGRAAELASVLGSPVPSIIYDESCVRNRPMYICISHNGDATFVNYDAAGGFKHPKHDLVSHGCELHALEAVKIDNAKAGAAVGEVYGLAGTRATSDMTPGPGLRPRLKPRLAGDSTAVVTLMIDVSVRLYRMASLIT